MSYRHSPRRSAARAAAVGLLATVTLVSLGTTQPAVAAPAAPGSVSDLAGSPTTRHPAAGPASSGHVGPLLQAAPALVSLLRAFWRDPHATVAEHRTETRARG